MNIKFQILFLLIVIVNLPRNAISVHSDSESDDEDKKLPTSKHKSTGSSASSDDGSVGSNRSLSSSFRHIQEKIQQNKQKMENLTKSSVEYLWNMLPKPGDTSRNAQSDGEGSGKPPSLLKKASKRLKEETVNRTAKFTEVYNKTLRRISSGNNVLEGLNATGNLIRHVDRLCSHAELLKLASPETDVPDEKQQESNEYTNNAGPSDFNLHGYTSDSDNDEESNTPRKGAAHVPSPRKNAAHAYGHGHGHEDETNKNEPESNIISISSSPAESFIFLERIGSKKRLTQSPSSSRLTPSPSSNKMHMMDLEKSTEKSSESPQKGRKKAQPSPVGLKSAIRFALRKYFCDVRKRKKDADLGDWKPIPNENPKHGIEEKLPDHEDKEEHLFLRDDTRLPHKFGYDFKFRVYFPDKFKNFLHSFPNFNVLTLLLSLTKEPMGGFENPAQSDSLFFTSWDKRFFLKSVALVKKFHDKLWMGFTEMFFKFFGIHMEALIEKDFFFHTPDKADIVGDGEIRRFHNGFERYLKFIQDNPNTYLPKFYALFGIQTMNAKGEIEFEHLFFVQNFLMPNENDMEIKYKFDLKGSSNNRLTNKTDASNYMDLDFRRIKMASNEIEGLFPHGIQVQDEVWHRIDQQIRADTKFLSGLGILDYSLLLGVAEVDENEISPGLPATCKLEEDTHQVQHGQKQKSKHLRIFFGIIDILQAFVERKKMEITLKNLFRSTKDSTFSSFPKKRDGMQIYPMLTIIPPQLYRERFVAYITKVVLTKESEGPKGLLPVDAYKVNLDEKGKAVRAKGLGLEQLESPQNLRNIIHQIAGPSHPGPSSPKVAHEGAEEHPKVDDFDDVEENLEHTDWFNELVEHQSLSSEGSWNDIISEIRLHNLSAVAEKQQQQPTSSSKGGLDLHELGKRLKEKVEADQRAKNIQIKAESSSDDEEKSKHPKSLRHEHAYHGRSGNIPPRNLPVPTFLESETEMKDINDKHHQN